MEAKATAKYVRVSPRKAGQICDLVRLSVSSDIQPTAIVFADGFFGLRRHLIEG